MQITKKKVKSLLMKISWKKRRKPEVRVSATMYLFRKKDSDVTERRILLRMF
jgi:hypothetical protein